MTSPSRSLPDLQRTHHVNQMVIYARCASGRARAGCRNTTDKTPKPNPKVHEIQLANVKLATTSSPSETLAHDNTNSKVTMEILGNLSRWQWKRDVMLSGWGYPLNLALEQFGLQRDTQPQGLGLGTGYPDPHPYNQPWWMVIIQWCFPYPPP